MSPSTAASSRWCPTPEQLIILEEMYRGGINTPTSSQIQQITGHLSNFGKIEGKNVFYWFQNHKARDRQKLRKKLGKQLQLQEQQQQQQLLHNTNNPQTRNHHVFSASSIRSLPHVHPYYYHSAAAASLLPQEGVIGGTSSWMINNGTWKMDNRGRVDMEMDKQAEMKLYDHDGAWIIMIDNMDGPFLSTPSPPSNYKPPLKTLDLFPTKATSLRNDPSL